MSFLSAKGLAVSLGHHPVLKGLEFSIDEGAFVGLLGPNGSGKTTLVRSMAGLLPYNGQLLLQNKEVAIWDRRSLAQTVCWIQQRQDLGFDFTVKEFVSLGLIPHLPWLARGLSELGEQRIMEVLDTLELASLNDRAITALSGGEQQRLLLAQALVQDTPFLLFDEPTTHLDVYHAFDLISRMQSLVEAGRTVVTVLHDLELAARYCDHLLILHEGELIAAGSPEEVVSPELVHEVFRMKASIELDRAGKMRIDYLRTASS